MMAAVGERPTANREAGNTGMGDRLTRIYTRTGDDGTTGLADGSRRAKHDTRIACLGEVDELNACIGFASSLLGEQGPRDLLLAIQHDLFDVGAELCQPGKLLIDAAYVAALEASADRYNAELPALREFILPGGSQAAACLHLARTVCRRVERGLTRLADGEAVNDDTLRYLNRLSDLLFILARAQSAADGGSEVCWNTRYSRVQRD